MLVGNLNQTHLLIEVLAELLLSYLFSCILLNLQVLTACVPPFGTLLLLFNHVDKGIIQLLLTIGVAVLWNHLQQHLSRFVGIDCTRIRHQFKAQLLVRISGIEIQISLVE